MGAWSRLVWRWARRHMSLRKSQLTRRIWVAKMRWSLRTLEIGGAELAITCLAIGNPHAVAIMDEPVEDFPLTEVGPHVENHPMFPQRINFEIVNVHARDKIRARIFERGAGETMSSGTGSTASAFACRKLGLVDDAVDVVVDGGVLRISWDENDEAFLEGPAVEVFTGVWNE